MLSTVNHEVYVQSQERDREKLAPRVTGHDAVLGSIRKDGREITVVKSDGSVVKGKLVASDSFSLSVSVGPIVRVLFKHAIDEFFTSK